MTPFIWRDRMVKLDIDGTLMFSRKHRHTDFDFGCAEAGDDVACAMRVGMGSDHILHAEPRPSGRLLIENMIGTYELTDDQWSRAVLHPLPADCPVIFSMQYQAPDDPVVVPAP